MHAPSVKYWQVSSSDETTAADSCLAAESAKSGCCLFGFFFWSIGEDILTFNVTIVHWKEDMPIHNHVEFEPLLVGTYILICTYLNER